MFDDRRRVIGEPVREVGVSDGVADPGEKVRVRAVKIAQLPHNRLFARRQVGGVNQAGEILQVIHPPRHIGQDEFLRLPLPAHERGDVRVIRGDIAEDLAVPVAPLG